MNTQRLLVAAVLASLAATPALAAQPGLSGYASELADTTVKCYDLMSQFDHAVHGMKATKAVHKAKMLRMRGARQCAAEEDIAVVRKGAKTLEHALKEIGQKPTAS